jgi:hypothetical protein
MIGDRLRDLGRPRVEAMDHDGLHRDELAESLEIGSIEPGPIEPGLRPELELAVVRHFLLRMWAID